MNWGAILLLLVILFSGCTGVNEINEGDITLLINELPDNVKLSDIKVNEIDNPELEMEGIDVRAFELGPDGMQFNEPVTITLDIERAPGNSTVLPVLILQSGDDMRLMDASYEISEDKIQVKTNVTHFSTLYHGKPQRMGIEPHWSSKNVEGFFEVSSPISKVKAELGVPFTLPIEVKRVNDKIKFKTHEDHYYQLLPEGQLMDGSYQQNSNDLYTRGTARLDNHKINIPPGQMDFSSGEFTANPTFTCTEPGKTTVWYGGYIKFTYKQQISIIDNENWEFTRYETFSLAWEIECILPDTDFSCRKRTPKWYIDYHVPVDQCVDDCGETDYCDMEKCKCEQKKFYTCNTEVGHKITDTDYCQDKCPPGTECMPEYCVCEPIAIEISCNENSWTDESSEWERFKCKSDCPDDMVCRVEDCVCVENAETIIEAGEVTVVGEDITYKVTDDGAVIRDVIPAETGDGRIGDDVTPDAGATGDESTPEGAVTGDYESTPEGAVTGDIEEYIDDLKKLAECTPDPFEYGEIKVMSKSGSADWEVAADGYSAGILDFSWKLDAKQRISGIILNYKITGPDGESTGWERTDDEGVMSGTKYVTKKGIYTISIVDFDTFGSYCGDGDRIEITI